MMDSVVIAGITNTIGYLISAPLKTERYYDLFGGFTFICIGLRQLFKANLQRLPTLPVNSVASILMCMWAFRLGSFLVYRVHKKGPDGRFDKIKIYPLKFLFYWFMQGVWNVLISMPVAISHENDAGSDVSILSSTVSKVGLGLFLAGFAVESVADYQKLTFGLDSKNKDKFIDKGLWSIVRHPNYAGEMTIWWGAFLLVWPTLRTYRDIGLGLLSPLFIMLLLTSLSGVNLLEERGMKKWGNDPSYLAYMKRTHRFLPFYIPFINP